MNNKEIRQLIEKKNVLVNKILKLLYEEKDELTQNLWDLITIAENYGCTCEHLENYQHYVCKEDQVTKDYELLITKESLELHEKFLNLVEKYNNKIADKSASCSL